MTGWARRDAFTSESIELHEEKWVTQSMSNGHSQILEEVVWIRDDQAERRNGGGRDLVFVQIPETVTPSFTRYLTEHFSDHGTDRLLRLEAACPESTKPLPKLYRGLFRHCEWNRWRDNAWLITFLCDPVRRIVAQYLADRGPTSSQRVCAAMDPAMRKILRFARRATLEEYVSSEDPQVVTRLANLQTRVFSSFPTSDHPQFLSTAVRNLEQEFLFLGIAEDYETSIQMARVQFGSNAPLLFYRPSTSSQRGLSAPAYRSRARSNSTIGRQ